MERYICLPSYNCRCKPGKPVSRTTLWTHRRLANLARARNGEPELPLGPRYSESVAASIREGRIPITDPAQHEVQEASNLALEAPVSVSLDDELQHDSEAIDSRPLDVRRSASQNVVIASAVNAVDHAERIDALVEGYYSESIGSSPEEIGEQEYSLPQDESDESDDESVVQRAIPRERFISWAMNNKKWVELAIDFSAKQTIMQRILSNIDAPYKSWKTIMRNVEKYSGLSTVKYLSCRNHVLFYDTFVQNGIHSIYPLPECPICSEGGTQPEYSVFEYIPLLPRVAAWVKNEESCDTLFRYMADNMSTQTEERDGVSDFFDGTLYQRIIDQSDGTDEDVCDIFIGASTDGFEVFDNNSYICWPIAALNLNLSPNQRFLMRNVIPFGFVGGKGQPADLESFLVPLVVEITEINRDGGTLLPFHDGRWKRTRVNLLSFPTDLQALPKVAGIVGPSGKSPCHFCDLFTVYFTRSKRYYCPSVVRESEEAGSSSARRSPMVRRFNPRALNLRDRSRSRAIIRALNEGSSNALNEVQRKALSKDSGIKCATILHTLPTIVPFHSFPVDTMHLGFNIAKDLMDIFKGENVHLKRLEGYLEEDMVIDEDSWSMVDKDLKGFGKSTPLSVFGPRPRETSAYKSWKAAEYQQFVLTYWLVVLDGHLPDRFMRGLRIFTVIVDLWSRPALSDEEILKLGNKSVEFYEHFEKDYYQYKPERVGLCKLTMHMLLHLRENVERCGPLVNCNQFWIERFIEFTKSRLHAKARAAEAMTSSAKMLEGYKLFYDSHFATQESPSEVGESDNDSSHSNDGATVIIDAKRRLEKLTWAANTRLALRQLLQFYIQATEGIDAAAARFAVQSEAVMSFNTVKIKCGQDFQSVGSYVYHSNRSRDLRENFYIAAEYPSDSEQEQDRNSADVYYGRVLKFVEYEFRLSTGPQKRQLFVADWASRLNVTPYGQVYHDSVALSRVFKDATIEDLTAITHMIGVGRHKYPSHRRFSPLIGEKLFFLDPQREVHSLLSIEKTSPDGINRRLRGLARELQ